MKKNKKEELRTKTVLELEKDILKQENDLLQARLDLSVGKIKNTSSIRFMSDTLARMKTILKEKQLKLNSEKKETISKKGK